MDHSRELQRLLAFIERRGISRRELMRQGAAMTAAGVALGLVLAWWTGGLVAAYVYRVTSLDPAVIGGSVLSVGLVALTSSVAARGGA